MTTVLPTFRHQTALQALQLLQSGGSRDAATASGGVSDGLIDTSGNQQKAAARIGKLLVSGLVVDGSALRAGNDVQQSAAARISKLLLD
ncbi:hypothetical protein EOD23_05015, partial [Mesorhizobium sp. USDA-HM6]